MLSMDERTPAWLADARLRTIADELTAQVWVQGLCVESAHVRWPTLRSPGLGNRHSGQKGGHYEIAMFTIVARRVLARSIQCQRVR